MGHVPQHPVGGVEPDRRAGCLAQRRGGGDVVVVPVGEHDRGHPPAADGLDDRGGVVRGVDHQHLVVVPDQPDVVVDVEVLPVEAEHPADDDLLDPSGHRQNTTTLRSTSPRCIFSKASSTSLRAMVSETNSSSGKRPCRYRSMSIGKSREGRQSPYQEDLTAPPRPKISIAGRVICMSGVGTPTMTTRPARARAQKACAKPFGWPTASMATSAPTQPVSALIVSAGSARCAVTVWVAPSLRGHSSFRSSMSTATIVLAPASLAPAIAASPTPPQPKTATLSPRCTAPVLIAAPTPAITPQPSSPAAVGGAAGSTLVHCPECTSVFSTNAPMPSAGVSSVPSVSVIFCAALCVSKQYCGWPLAQARHCPHTARQLRIT